MVSPERMRRSTKQCLSGSKLSRRESQSTAYGTQGSHQQMVTYRLKQARALQLTVEMRPGSLFLRLQSQICLWLLIPRHRPFNPLTASTFSAQRTIRTPCALTPSITNHPNIYRYLPAILTVPAVPAPVTVPLSHHLLVRSHTLTFREQYIRPEDHATRRTAQRQRYRAAGSRIPSHLLDQGRRCWGRSTLRMSV